MVGTVGIASAPHVAFSIYNGPVPSDSLFGRAENGFEVLCTNPAALGGGSGTLTPIYPSEPFAPGVIGSAVTQLGRLPTASSPWIEIPRAYRARCSSGDGANVLQVTPVGEAPRLTPTSPGYGLHLVDANLSLGNLVDLVRRQARHYERTQRRGWDSNPRGT